MTKQPRTRAQDENKQQVAAFRKAARELGADESEEQFQDALRKIAKHKPTKERAKD